MNKLNILFLGGAKRVSMASKFIEAGRRAGFETAIYGYELSRRCALAAVAEEIVEGRRWSDPALLDDLHEVVTSRHISIMIPFVDPAIEVVARYRDKFSDIFAPVGDADTCRRMFDKIFAAQAFEKAGIAVPETLSGANPRFPLIAKPRKGSASQGILIVENRADWEALSIFHPDYLIQEYITDAIEYTVDCYRSVGSGETLAVSPRQRLATAGGEVISTITVDDADITELARLTLEKLDLRGAVTVQMLRDPSSRRAVVMEVNPRLGGGAVAAVCAGADIPALIIAEATDRPLKPTEARSGILVQRYLNEISFDTNENR